MRQAKADTSSVEQDGVSRAADWSGLSSSLDTLMRWALRLRIRPSPSPPSPPIAASTPPPARCMRAWFATDATDNLAVLTVSLQSCKAARDVTPSVCNYTWLAYAYAYRHDDDDADWKVRAERCTRRAMRWRRNRSSATCRSSSTKVAANTPCAALSNELKLKLLQEDQEIGVVIQRRKEKNGKRQDRKLSIQCLLFFGVFFLSPFFNDRHPNILTRRPRYPLIWKLFPHFLQQVLASSPLPAHPFSPHFQPTNFFYYFVQIRYGMLDDFTLVSKLFLHFLYHLETHLFRRFDVNET